MAVLYIFIAILVLLFMITVHEFGHYIAGKALGFKINEFAIGFGKAIFKRTNKKTGEVFALRLIPLGGYCAFAGDDADSMDGKTETNEKLVASEKDYVPYNKMAPWKRLIVLFSGAFANFICAIIFAWILLMSIGYNHTVTIGTLDTESHNYYQHASRDDTNNPGLKEGDIIVAINGNKMTYLDSYSKIVSELVVADEKDPESIATYGVMFTVQRGNDTVDVWVYKAKIANAEEADGYYYGIGRIDGTVDYQKMGFFAAIPKAFEFSFDLAKMMLEIFGQLITGKMSLANIGGPFTTISVMSQSIGAHALNLLILIPLISVNLAVFNLLPIPALDGARMVFVLIEWIRRKPINPEIENRIHLIGLLLLFGLVLLLDFNYLFLR